MIHTTMDSLSKYRYNYGIVFIRTEGHPGKEFIGDAMSNQDNNTIFLGILYQARRILQVIPGMCIRTSPST